MKAVDFDKLFEKFVRRYIAANRDKYPLEDWENHIGELYNVFSRTQFDELEGKTPSDYFKGEKNLLGILREYTEKGFPITDELIDEIAKTESDENLSLLFNENEDEQLLFSVMEVYRRRGGKLPVNRYIDLLFSRKTDVHVKNEIAEEIIPVADSAKEYILERLEGKPNGIFAEILSHTTDKDEKIKKILLDGLKDIKKIPEYSAYLVNFGDESCLPQMIERLNEINDFIAYRELKNAIEALGGAVDCEKDFSADSDYLYVKEHDAPPDDENPS